MAFERFTKDARATVMAARAEALAAGHATIEAEHLLLALSERPDLQALGLDREQLSYALAAEEERSLAAVGVAASGPDEPIGPRRPRDPQFATSAKLALHRAVSAAAKRGDRRLDARHVLLGVLGAQYGRVPRALQIAEIDVDALRARI
ncbi:MAG: hypothetical protein JO130_07280 [Solirubrobacterales bacterium]|nr:hypothetical protein [Solirubrobacterales bacterium]